MPASLLPPRDHLPGSLLKEPEKSDFSEILRSPWELVGKPESGPRPFIPLLVHLLAPRQCPSLPDIPSGSKEQATPLGRKGTQPPMEVALGGSLDMPAVDCP